MPKRKGNERQGKRGKKQGDHSGEIEMKRDWREEGHLLRMLD
jgi:hypothetical protein